jgi:hypothetical protein
VTLPDLRGESALILESFAPFAWTSATDRWHSDSKVDGCDRFLRKSVSDN